MFTAAIFAFLPFRVGVVFVFAAVLRHFFRVTHFPVLVHEVVTGEFRSARFAGVILHVHVQEFDFAFSIARRFRGFCFQTDGIQVSSGVLLVTVLGFKRVVAVETREQIVAVLLHVVFVAQLFISDVFVHHFVHHFVSIDLVESVFVFFAR